MNYLLLNSTASAIIDVVALAILVIFAISGLTKGFVKTFVSVFGTIISLLLAVLLCSQCANFLQNQFGFITTVTEKVSNVVNSVFGEELANTTLNNAIESSLSESGLSSWLIKIILEAKNDGTIPMDTTLNQIISPALAYYTVCGISIVLLFVVFKILLFILGDMTKKLSALSLVGAVNKALGLLLGFVRGVIIIQFAVIIINALPIGFVQQLSLVAQNSKIVGFICNINIFDIIIKSISHLDILSFIKSSV